MNKKIRYWCEFHKENAVASDWKLWRERKKEYGCIIVKITEHV